MTVEDLLDGEDMADDDPDVGTLPSISLTGHSENSKYHTKNTN